MRAILAAMAVLAASPAAAQLNLPGLGGGQSPATMGALQGVFGQQTPEQRRAFCTRVAGAARNCGFTLDMSALGACLIRTLPQEDSVRVARVANTASGNPMALLGECGISGR